VSDDVQQAGRSLHATLVARRDALLQAWTRRVLDDEDVPEANRLSAPALSDHIPALVDRIIRSLEEARGGPEAGEAAGRDIGGDRRAKLHAHARLDQRFSLSSAMRELSHLRSTFIELCYDESAHVRSDEATLLHAAVDEAMTTVAVEMDGAARAALEEEARFRERFIGIVGHDLRSPLAAIGFAATLLLQQEDGTEAQARVVRRIARSVGRMSRMIGELLDFTRSREGGGMPLTRAPVDMHEVCRAVIEEIELGGARHQVRLESRGNPYGFWDADRLAQVLSNLIGNALEHGAPDRPVVVRVSDASDSRIRMEVHNHGRPIAPELLPSVFDPFQQSVEPGTRAGLGLGLFIAEQIVSAHGGSIRVTSDAAYGTTFTVELPR
jgi:signal transduction histidine kinase